MKRNLMIAAAAGGLLLATGAPQPAEAQHRGGVRVAGGHGWGAGPGVRHVYRTNFARAPRVVYRGGYYGGGWYPGWGFGPAAVLGGIAALATAPFWLAGGGFFPAAYGYDYGYDAYPVSYGGYYPIAYGGGYPVYYDAPAYVTYAPRRVVYATRVIRPRVVRVRYVQPRRVVVQRAGYRPHVRRVIVR